MKYPNKIFTVAESYGINSYSVVSAYKRDDDFFLEVKNDKTHTLMSMIVNSNWNKSGSRLVFTDLKEIKSHISEYLIKDIETKKSHILSMENILREYTEFIEA